MGICVVEGGGGLKKSPQPFEKDNFKFHQSLFQISPYDIGVAQVGIVLLLFIV